MMRKRSRKTGTNDQTEVASRPMGERLRWSLPCAVAFLASFCVMVVELVAGRLVARHLGASLYTWTSVIGVVLTGLAMGHYVGGRLADRYRPTRCLSVLFIVASGCCLLSLPLNRAVGDWEALGALNWSSHVAVHVTLIFLWPAAVLGTVSPVVAKMALDLGRQTGRTVGNVYAWGAIGSIVGTFMTGYWFIAAIGSTATIGLVAGVLAAVGVAFSVRSWLTRIWTTVMVLLALLLVSPWPWARAATVDLGLREVRPSRAVYRDESAYSFIEVAEHPDDPDLRSIRLDHLIHSWVFKGDPTKFHYDYEHLYAAATRRVAGNRRTLRTLFLGGGGYSFPRYVEHVWPGSTIEVAEIDPAVTRAARAALGLDPDASIRIHHLDARNYVDDLLRARRRGQPVPRFDVIYGDVFNDYMVPYHLTTVEFNESLREVLADDGVYLLNVIDILASGQFLGAVVSTLHRSFDHVWVFGSRTGLTALDPYSRDTFVVAASPSDLGLERIVETNGRNSSPGTILAAKQVEELQQRCGGLVLTDDYAPVEWLVAPLYQQTSLDRCQQLNDLALALAMRRKYKRAVDYYRQALRLRPGFAEARSNLGWALYQLGEHDRAFSELRQAVEQDPSLASAQNNLGWALFDQGRYDEAIDALSRALQSKPDFVLARNNLGLALAARGQIAEAVEQYRYAIRIQPSFAEAHYNLGVALTKLGREDQALEAYRRVLELKPRHAEARNDVGWLLHQQGRDDEAEVQLRAAVEIDPGFARAMDNLGAVLTAEGKLDEAVATYADLLRRHPGDVSACNGLGIALARQGQAARAVHWFTEALKFQPDYGPARDNLLATYVRTAQFDQAVALLRTALERTPDQPGVLSNLAWLLATCPKAELRNGTEAVRLARRADELSGGRSPRALDSLAAAYAETGDFVRAIATVQRAQELATALGKKELASEMADRLRAYRAGKPFRHRQ